MQSYKHGHIDGSVHSRALVVQSWSHRGLCIQQKFKMQLYNHGHIESCVHSRALKFINTLKVT